MQTKKLAIVAALTAGTLVTGIHSAWAEWSVSAGIENFRWGETTSPSVDESGVRHALGLNWIQDKAIGFVPAYRFKYYKGDVDYTGAFLFTGAPISGTTKYWGMAHELQLIYRTPDPTVEYVFGLGWDSWERNLSPFQREDYDVYFLRIGANINARTKQGVYGGGGLKYPLRTREDAHLTSIGFDQNPELRPGNDLSLYGELAYRFNQNWDLVGYYDSFRFRQSNSPTVTGGGLTFNVFQPKSNMDVVGLKLQYTFSP